MTIPTLTTTCLTLRPFTERDVEPLHRILTQDAMQRLDVTLGERAQGQA